MEIKSGIYKITNTVNQKIYIGSATKLLSRKSEHFHYLKNNKHHSRKLQNSFNKYGIDNFCFDIIEYIEDKTKLIEREQYYLDLLNPYYNICKFAGSTLGLKKSKESIEKSKIGYLKLISEKGAPNKGIPKSEEHKQKIGDIHRGKTVSQESIQKRKDTILKTRGNFSWQTLESIQKTLTTKREKGNLVHSKESYIQMFKTRKEKGNFISTKGRKKTLEEIEKQASKIRKPILQFDLKNNFVKEHVSIKAAGDDMNIDRSAIGRAVRGIVKTSCGFIWKYKNVA